MEEGNQTEINTENKNENEAEVQAPLGCPYSACKLNCGTRSNHRAKYAWISTKKKYYTMMDILGVRGGKKGLAEGKAVSSLIDYQKLEEFLNGI